MTEKSLAVHVMPGVLRWARESSGIRVEQAARRIGRNADTLTRWEAGDASPTLRSLEVLAGLYRRPLAALFLPEAPAELPAPTDFRTPPRAKRRPLSSKTLLAIRRARRLQRLATEFRRELGSVAPTSPSPLPYPEDPEGTAERERRRLGVTPEEQFQWRDPWAAFRGWRAKLEDSSILVLQLPMPVEEARGFCLAGAQLPVIVVSSGDLIQARIFTLFHEHAHLLQGTAALCIPGEGSGDPAERPEVERFCDQFAAALLVPRDAFLGNSVVRAVSRMEGLPDDALSEIAGRFKVSREVVWRRLRALDLIEDPVSRARLDLWRRRASHKRKGRGAPHVTPAQRCISEKGPLFASLVLRAKEAGRITTRDMAEFLSVRVKYLNQIESLLRAPPAHG